MSEPTGDVRDLGTILGVWAHPDDETYLSAMHMRRALLAGSRVACVTATRGEQGSPDPERWPPGEPLARIRTAELEAALGVLGVDDHTWLDYPDGGCAAVPFDEGTGRVLEQIRRVRPDTVLTFGPDGMTGHSDHRTVSAWVDAAVALVDGDRPQVLQATNTPEWLARWKPTLDELDVYMEGEPPSHPLAELRSYIKLSPDERDTKLQALLCQTSQIEPIVQGLGADALRDAFSEEAYR